mmetsp:Transcript_19108/g.48311  ORF Transcript_19108/g.48311 Transcript_19108/m.48311 type:complete len:212 (-) Transcript_19108:94-729(-)
MSASWRAANETCGIKALLASSSGNLIALLLVVHLLDEPLKAVREALRGLGRASLDLERALVVELQRFGDLRGGHGAQKVLLVGENEERDASELGLLEERAELLGALVHAGRVGAVDHVNKCVSVVVVVAPVGADGLLATNVPDVELEAVGLDRLDVEALGRHDVVNVLAGQLLEDGGLSSVVKAEHEHARLVVRALELAKHVEETHVSFGG